MARGPNGFNAPAERGTFAESRGIEVANGRQIGPNQRESDERVLDQVDGFFTVALRELQRQPDERVIALEEQILVSDGGLGGPEHAC